ncbi:MAG: hypothetical protein KJ906_04060 [Nanoarchaeota archaeon]|nr:hypothetical protein [Nanoarchaeota archaeon]
MKKSIRKGFGFGLTSGIITTLGIIVGLAYGTNSKIAVLGGILVIAIADALSDSLGIHISEESNGIAKKEIWESTISTFVTKFIVALSFVVPVFLLSLVGAVIVSIIWGLSLIVGFSFYISKKNQIKSYKSVLEHLTIAILVIIITYYLGTWVSTFG